ncbi:MAG TPA: polysaccharide deacetylase family protein [Pseudomonadales bacterium]|nr:polysaccharide deacetylase family protein [Pseudomonadales bacterium]
MQALLRRALLTVALLVLGACSEGGTPAAAATGDDAVILQYHFIATDTPAVTSVSPERFAEHMDYLEAQGFTILPLPELLDRLRSGRSIPARSAAITFDDGYRSVYTEAFPRLEARNWPFTVFVNTAAIETPGRTFASWEELREMQAAGATIANHSVNHPYLVRGSNAAGEESDAQFEARMHAEIEVAQQRLVEQLGIDNRLFAYPYGEYDDRVRAWLARNDYLGIGQHSGAVWSGTDFTAVPRFPFSGDYAAMDELREKLETKALRVQNAAALPSPALATREARPELRLTVATQGIRADRIACYATGQGATETSVRDLGDGRVEVVARARMPVRAGRSRYNCTAPRDDGGFAWFSQPWLRELAADVTPP